MTTNNTYNPFKIKIDEYKAERKKHRKAIVLFDKKIKKAMCLSKENIEYAYVNRITWHIPGYELWINGVDWNDIDDRNIIFVIPNTISLVYMFNDRTRPPGDWHFHRQGEEILPPKKERDKILRLIEKEFEVNRLSVATLNKVNIETVEEVEEKE